MIDDDEDEPLLAGATDLDEQVAIRGMHAVRAYSADPTRSAPVLGEVLGMEPKGAGRWLASGERRHGLVVYDPHRRNEVSQARARCTTSHSQSATASRTPGGLASPRPGFGRRPFWIAR